MSKPIRVVQYGLGAIGRATARLVLTQPHLELVGAVEHAPRADLRLHALHVAVLVVVGLLAARKLARTRGGGAKGTEFTSSQSPGGERS